MVKIVILNQLEERHFLNLFTLICDFGVSSYFLINYCF